MEDGVNDDPVCHMCASLLIEPYIQCTACETTLRGQVTLCLHCFSKGAEFDSHKSDHPYFIIKNNFPVFERSWTALEEMQLLKAVGDCGYGNWSDVAHKVRTKNVQECERHYNRCYIDEPKDGLPVFPEAKMDFFPRPIIYKLCEDPPRPADGSLLGTEMAGYMAGRGDFMTEPENFMELDLRGLEFDRHDDAIDTELKLAVVDVYLRCIKERKRWKRIIRKYGLINPRKNARLKAQYDLIVSQYLDGLRVFAQLVSPLDYDLYLESLQYEQELKKDILQLQEYRRNRLTKVHQIKMFQSMQKLRDKKQADRNLLNDVLNHVKDENACQTWLQKQAALESLGKGTAYTLPNASRKSAPPLDITELPGYDKLTYRERDLCSQLRLVPVAFIDFKAILIAEAERYGRLRLAQARTLIKIDVNKTRKIFDFLVAEEYIKKE